MDHTNPLPVTGILSVDLWVIQSVKKKYQLHPRSLTAHPWKQWWLFQDYILSYWGPVTFQGRTVKLREGSILSYCWWKKSCTTWDDYHPWWWRFCQSTVLLWIWRCDAFNGRQPTAQWRQLLSLFAGWDNMLKRVQGILNLAQAGLPILFDSFKLWRPARHCIPG